MGGRIFMVTKHKSSINLRAENLPTKCSTGGGQEMVELPFFSLVPAATHVKAIISRFYHTVEDDRHNFSSLVRSYVFG